MNSKPNTLVIGDIHGCLTTLKELVSKVDIATTNLISVGDLIDRGPDSLGVIQYCIDNNIQVCLGNHELMMLDAMEDWLGLDHPYKRMGLLSSDWFNNGGAGVFDQLATFDSIQFVVDYFKSLPIYIKLNHEVNGLPVVVSHTCLNNYSYDVLNATQDDLRRHATSFVWSRSQATNNTGAFFNIYGHTPTDYIGIKNTKPLITKFGVNLDTGCVYQSEGRGVLTGIILPSFEIIQQERL